MRSEQKSQIIDNYILLHIEYQILSKIYVKTYKSAIFGEIISKNI